MKCFHFASSKTICLALLSIFCCSKITLAQKTENYWDYHAQIYRAEKLILSERFDSALATMDSVFTSFEHVFTKDFVIAAQLALIQKDTVRSKKYLLKAMQNGFRLSALSKWSNFKNLDLSDLFRIEEDVRADYLRHKNIALNRRLSMNFRFDEDNKSTNEAKRIFNENFLFIKKMTDSLGFPGIRSVGIDDRSFDDRNAQNQLATLRDAECDNSKVIVSLLHYGPSVSALVFVNCLKFVENGQLHVGELAAMLDFERMHYRKNGLRPPATFPKIDLGGMRGSANEDDCARFFVLTPAQKEQKRAIETKYRLKLSFGYQN